MPGSLFPGGVITEVAAPWMWDAALPPEEEAIIAKAVEKRRREFTAGRTCARAILNQLGFRGDLPIGKGRHGAPLWPEGIIGSISHTDDVCIVAIARRTAELRNLGVDVEKACGLDPDLVELVCDTDEWQACRDSRQDASFRRAKVIFSAKESVYKCLYPVIRTVLDFDDVHISFDKTGRKFTATVPGKTFVKPDGTVCCGTVVCMEKHIYTGSTLIRR